MSASSNLSVNPSSSLTRGLPTRLPLSLARSIPPRTNSLWSCFLPRSRYQIVSPARGPGFFGTRSLSSIGATMCGTTGGRLCERELTNPDERHAEGTFQSVIDTNLKSIWLCMKYEIPQMLEQGSGAIVNTSSIAGLVGVPQQPIYVASKHAVSGLSKSAAVEYPTEEFVLTPCVQVSLTRPSWTEYMRATRS